MKRAWPTSIACLLTVATVCGCAGARVDVVADRALYPISMSGSVRDNTGTLHDLRSLKIVGPFDVEEKRIGLFYSTTMPGGKFDISDAVNTQVQAAGGEAVIRLSITVDESCHWVNELFPLSILPFWPGCVPVKIHGAIVRRKTGAPPF